MGPKWDFGRISGWETHLLAREQYACLYNITWQNQNTIAKVFNTSPLDISWRCDFIGSKLAALNELLPHIANIMLTQEHDVFR